MSGSNTTGNVLGATTVTGTGSAVLFNTGHNVMAAVLLAIALSLLAIVVTVFFTKKAVLAKSK